MIAIVLNAMPPLVFSTTIEEHYNAGQKYLEKEEYDKAISELQMALEIDPNLPPIYNMLGIVYLRQNKSIESAIGSFQEAIRIDPNYAEAYYNLAITYLDENAGNNPDSAVASFEKVIQISPQFAKAYVGLGFVTLTKLQNPEKALEYINRAIALDPNQAEAYFYQGIAYTAMKKQPEALKPLSTLRSLQRYDLATNLEQYMRNEEQKKEELSAQLSSDQLPEAKTGPTKI